MRLSQLARKLEISPSELIKFFENQGLDYYSSHNNKIRKDDENLAFKFYHTKGIQDENEDAEKTVSESDSGNQLKSENYMHLSYSDEDFRPSPLVNLKNKQNKDNAEIEIIRMPKIKLEGVKVVGKIDLPEPVRRKSQIREDPDQNTSFEEKTERKSGRKKSGEDDFEWKRYKRKKHHQTRKKPELSYEQKLQLEEKKRITAQKKLKKLRKEKKKQHYIRSVQTNSLSSTKKKKTRTLPEPYAIPKAAKPAYKNPLRRIWAWLNGEYDEH
jgi:hypothetical protein